MVKLVKLAECSIEGVIVKSPTEVPEDIVDELNKDFKEAVKSTWEFKNVKESVDFVTNRHNPLQKLAAKGEIGRIDYLALETENEKYEANNFAANGVKTTRQIMLAIKDRFGRNHKITATIGDPALERLPALDNFEIDDKLGLSGSELEKETMKGLVIHSQQKVGPDFYTDEASVWAYRDKVKLKNDTPKMKEMLNGAKEYFAKYEGKFKTDVAEKIRTAFVDVIPESLSQFEKAALNPSVSPSGMIFGEQTADVRLAAFMQELKDEAYDTLQRLHNEKGEDFFTQLKKLFSHKTKAQLLFPENVKEGRE
jgi:hypothetical protein